MGKKHTRSNLLYDTIIDIRSQ